MALPTLTKTWQHNVNNAISALGSALANNRRALRLIKNAMIGFGSAPWTVRYSCNSTTAGTAGDGVDRWTADSDLVWANPTQPHSWIVLRQTGISSTFEVLISCEGANGAGAFLTLAWSTSAFSGGSTTARPTAAGEVVPINSVQHTLVVTDVAQRWSVMQSSDGEVTRIFGAASGSISYFISIEKPANPVTGWTAPVVSFARLAASPTAAAFTSASSTLGKMRNGSTTGEVVMTCEGNATSLIPVDITYGNIVNEISSEWPMVPIGIESYTVGVRGRHGTLQDLWFGSSQVATGDTYPNDSSNQFAQIGNLILPWNGGALNLT